MPIESIGDVCDIDDATQTPFVSGCRERRRERHPMAISSPVAWSSCLLAARRRWPPPTMANQSVSGHGLPSQTGRMA